MATRYVTWIDGVEATVEILGRESGHIVARIEPTDEAGEPRIAWL